MLVAARQLREAFRQTLDRRRLDAPAAKPATLGVLERERKNLELDG